jgi:thymidylate synthase (FAD)
MTAIQLRSDMDVELIKSSAADSDILWAARVSTIGELSRDVAGPLMPGLGKADAGLINFLMKNHHGTPFEHSTMTFYVSAPIFVFREFMRHRIASYNEESGRYTQLKPVFYVPDKERALVQEGKPGHYTFVPGTQQQYEDMHGDIRNSCKNSYETYVNMLSNGIAREVARMVLPLTIYSSMYVTMNARGLMNFLSLRVKSDDSMFPSFPQREIEMVAEKIEAEWAKLMPVTYKSFVANGRVCP